MNDVIDIIIGTFVGFIVIVAIQLIWEYIDIRNVAILNARRAGPKINKNIRRNKIRVSDYTRFPAGRTPQDGPHNAETFRRQYLIPSLMRKNVVTSVSLDDLVGVPSNWLEVAFGNLREDFDLEYIKNHLEIVHDSPIYYRYAYSAWNYIENYPTNR